MEMEWRGVFLSRGVAVDYGVSIMACRLWRSTKKKVTISTTHYSASPSSLLLPSPSPHSWSPLPAGRAWIAAPPTEWWARSRVGPGRGSSNPIRNGWWTPSRAWWCRCLMGAA